MTFTAEMTKALAWPVALVVTSLIFRPTISGLLEGVRLRRIGKGEWSADFETAAKEVRAELPSPAQDEPERAVSGLLNEEMEHLVDIAPAAAISQAWNALEDRVAAIAEQAAVTQKLLPEVLRALVEKDVIQPAAADSILGLRNMRNLAVHAPPKRLTANQAREFITMVEAIDWTLGRSHKTAFPQRAEGR
jgi:hypothetical protein